jgi:serine/threonine protein kinase
MRDDSGEKASAEPEVHAGQAEPAVPDDGSDASPAPSPAPDMAEATPPSKPALPRHLESQRIALEDIESHGENPTVATITLPPPPLQRPASENARSPSETGRSASAAGRSMSESMRAPSAGGRMPSAVPTIPASRFPPGTVLAERYRIIHLLGRGGMGEVYRADDLKLGQPVALKFLPQSVEQDPDRLARLLDEVKIARAIAHPNVCRVYDVDELDGNHFLSMEYIDGENLTTLLRRIGRVPRDKAMELGVQICHGLAAVHAQGILHRDLKPANLMIDDRGRARIMDFGLASLSDGVAPNSISHGTPAYMAPEQLTGANVSIKSDLYALGLVLYQMFTGRPAFPGTVSMDLVWRRLETMPEPPSRVVDDIDPVVESAILRCLEVDPRDRPDSALDVAAALAASAAPTADAVLKAIVVCEPGDRNDWVQALGEDAAARLWRQQIERARALLAEHGGVALAGTGGLHTVFDRPIQAVRCALAYLRADDKPAPEEDVPVRPRIGIHLGEVSLRHDSSQTEPSLSLYPHVDAQARDTAVRLTTLAAPGQILLTRSAFDLARQNTVEGMDAVRWLAHGTYEIEGLLEPIELFEVGVEGASPLRPPAESKRARRQMVQSTVAGWRPAPGLEMPLRPNWAIERKLSEGGFGEVWLARHRKTHEPRVFKFCYDATSLRALQREITLFRLLKETLGERSDINRIFDWNFEDAPYFIESAYTAGGDLSAWAAEQGGLAGIPLETRLEIVAQVATALAAAHSVGVLHKDVKPANVLMTSDGDGRVQIMLSDFGIGHVTEKQRLAEAGITVVGLTEGNEGGASPMGGTRLYMAPELLEGKPATVRADIYALGVMLYQIVVGDFARALAPGWERGVADPLLREDIAAAVDDFDQRLGDASRLAERLRQLEARRQERAERERQLAEAAQAKEALIQGRRRRKYLGLLLAVVTVFAGAMVFQSRRIADEARAAEQVSNFLVDLFEVADPYKAAGNQITARQILDRGAARIETELRDQPAIRARLMHMMGVVYGNLGLYTEATSLLEQALATRQKLHGREHLEVAETQHALADVLADKINYAGAEELYRQALATRRERLGEEHTAVADSMHGLADVLYDLRKLDQAGMLARQALTLRRELLGDAHQDIAASLQLVGVVLLGEGAYEEADKQFRQAIEMHRKISGDGALEMAEPLLLLAKSRFLQKDYDAAEALIEQSLTIQRRALGDNHLAVAHGLHQQARIASEKGDPAHAEALFQQALAIYRTALDEDRAVTVPVLRNLAQLASMRGDFARAEKLLQEAIAVQRPLRREERLLGDLFTDLAFALHLQERHQEAEEAYRESLAVHERVGGATAPATLEARANLAALLIDAGKLDEAAPLVQLLEKEPDAGASARDGWLSHHVPSVLDAYRARTGQPEQAEAPLVQSLAAVEKYSGDDHTHAVLLARRRLAAFYESTGMAKKANEYRMLIPEDRRVSP